MWCSPGLTGSTASLKETFVLGSSLSMQILRKRESKPPVNLCLHIFFPMTHPHLPGVFLWWFCIIQSVSYSSYCRISFGCCGRFTLAELLSFAFSLLLVFIWVLTGHWLLMDGASRLLPVLPSTRIQFPSGCFILFYSWFPKNIFLQQVAQNPKISHIPLNCRVVCGSLELHCREPSQSSIEALSLDKMQFLIMNHTIWIWIFLSSGSYCSVMQHCRSAAHMFSKLRSQWRNGEK